MNCNLIKNSFKFVFSQFDQLWAWAVLGVKNIVFSGLLFTLWCFGGVGTIALVAHIIKPVMQQDGLIQWLGATAIILLFLAASCFVVKIMIKMANVWAINALDAAYNRPLRNFNTHAVSMKIPLLLLIESLLVLIGFICFIIPGIILTIRFSLARYVMLDQKCGIVQALRTSWNMTKGEQWPLFILLLIMAVYPFIGFVSWIFVPIIWWIDYIFPVSNLMYASVYVQLKKLQDVQTLTGETV